MKGGGKAGRPTTKLCGNPGKCGKSGATRDGRDVGGFLLRFADGHPGLGNVLGVGSRREGGATGYFWLSGLELLDGQHTFY